MQKTSTTTVKKGLVNGLVIIGIYAGLRVAETGLKRGFKAVFNKKKNNKTLKSVETEQEESAV